MLQMLQEDVAPLMLEKFTSIQLMLQSDRHAERLEIFLEVLGKEVRNLLKSCVQSDTVCKALTKSTFNVQR